MGVTKGDHAAVLPDHTAQWDRESTQIRADVVDRISWRYKLRDHRRRDKRVLSKACKALAFLGGKCWKVHIEYDTNQ